MKGRKGVVGDGCTVRDFVRGAGCVGWVDCAGWVEGGSGVFRDLGGGKLMLVVVVVVMLVMLLMWWWGEGEEESESEGLCVETSTMLPSTFFSFSSLRFLLPPLPAPLLPASLRG